MGILEEGAVLDEDDDEDSEGEETERDDENTDEDGDTGVCQDSVIAKDNIAVLYPVSSLIWLAL